MTSRQSVLPRMGNFKEIWKGLRIVEEKEDKLNHTKEELEVKTRLAASAENKLEGILRKLECELKSFEISLEETKASLQQSEQKLKLNESALVSADAKLCLPEKKKLRN